VLLVILPLKKRKLTVTVKAIDEVGLVQLFNSKSFDYPARMVFYLDK